MAGTFQEKLDALSHTVIERLRHDWPATLLNVEFGRKDFVSSLRVARYTFRALRYLCADQKREEYGWKWEHLILLPAANRTMLDVLFNVIFILEDAEARLAWYHKSGWREQKMEYDRLTAEYGTEPEWVEWLDGFSRMIGMGKGLFKITAAEESNPAKEIKPWPNPGKMPDYGINPKSRPSSRQFLHYLNDWFYREYSAQAHVSFSGMMRQAAVIFKTDLPQSEQEKLVDDGLPRLISLHLVRSAILLLSLVSEIEHYFNFGGTIPLRILELWHIFMPDFPEAKEIFEKRYESFWPATLITI
jgi:hypothetical protein